LIANFDVATGQVICPTCGDTRTEVDFAAHVRVLIESEPCRDLITDCLNTHQSESLVRLVAEIEGLEFDLGIKGESGIDEDTSSIFKRLEPSCCLSLHPKHSSWLNQIEIWFSILVRKLLLRASFISKDDLKARVLDFIDYFNRTMAKPLSGLIKVRYWQFNGKGIYAVLY